MEWLKDTEAINPEMVFIMLEGEAWMSNSKPASCAIRDMCDSRICPDSSRRDK